MRKHTQILREEHERRKAEERRRQQTPGTATPETDERYAQDSTTGR